jgi:hypothetical protein
MRKTHRELPLAFGSCGCQSALTTWCQEGGHGRCNRAEPMPEYETVITNKAEQIAQFASLFAHPTLSATGWHHEHVAMVWLADRVCRWVCPCECHQDRARVMTWAEAAWVRQFAWTGQMRRQPWVLPGTSIGTYDAAAAAARCECMVGVCSYCKGGRHQFCEAKFRPRRHPEDFLADVRVWIAGYPCRSLCPCDCPTTQTTEQTSLFELSTSP